MAQQRPATPSTFAGSLNGGERYSQHGVWGVHTGVCCTLPGASEVARAPAHPPQGLVPSLTSSHGAGVSLAPSGPTVRPGHPGQKTLLCTSEALPDPELCRSTYRTRQSTAGCIRNHMEG
ncbi:hypothetical protein CB1_000203007 [Camelus ferus]|nr:hypothetical protein CB1_000203007 [Camelus ferus]